MKMSGNLETESRKTSAPVSMFVFAHQDDEIGYFCLISRLVRDRTPLKMIWITDGAYSVPAEVRREETKAALGMIGVDSECFEFWDYPDGASIKYSVEIVDRLTERMREISPAEVYVPAYEGGHPDHDFAHFSAVIAASRLERSPLVFEAPLYNKYKALFVSFNRFIPASTPTVYTPMGREDVIMKFRGMLKYKSQFWITTFPLLLFGWPRLLERGEPYRRVPERDYLKPPHEGKLYYESYPLYKMLGVSFSDFRAAVERVFTASGS